MLGEWLDTCSWILLIPQSIDHSVSGTLEWCSAIVDLYSSKWVVLQIIVCCLE